MVQIVLRIFSFALEWSFVGFYGLCLGLPGLRLCLGMRACRLHLFVCVVSGIPYTVNPKPVCLIIPAKP